MPALSAVGEINGRHRLGFVYAAHGIIHSEWKPRQTGRQYELPPNLQPLAGVRDHFNIFTNLSHLEADSKGDGSGDHNRAAGAWLTGVHAYDRTRPGTEIRLATSADQIAAKHLGKDSRVPSIEMTLDPATQGACDSGDCFYVNTVSWRSDTSPHARSTARHLRAPLRRQRQRRAAARPRQAGRLLDSVLEKHRRSRRHSAAPTSKCANLVQCAKWSSAFSTRVQPRDRSAANNQISIPPASRTTRSSCSICAVGLPQRHHARVLADHGAR
jgi:hypothetical protein